MNESLHISKNINFFEGVLCKTTLFSRLNPSSRRLLKTLARPKIKTLIEVEDGKRQREWEVDQGEEEGRHAGSDRQAVCRQEALQAHTQACPKRFIYHHSLISFSLSVSVSLISCFHMLEKQCFLFYFVCFLLFNLMLGCHFLDNFGVIFVICGIWLWFLELSVYLLLLICFFFTFYCFSCWLCCSWLLIIVYICL